jgi:haloacid dehalogenase superfamily, subfamily IA, variant 3 with third motif having DD or ED/haloacid dehalogenase superfamily, subfamily IA, variant 1 with third motif having Dx(3-4)D or Dx(3-4)E
MKVKAILFDYGNTLITTRLDWNQVLRDNIRNLISIITLALPTIDPIQLVQDFLFLRAVGKQRAEREWVETTADDSLAQALSLQGLSAVEPQIIQHGVDAFFAPEERRYARINGVPEMLTRLKSAGLKLGLISNATSGRLIRRTLAKTGLTSYFDQVVVSADLGICKPNPLLFHHIIQALQADPASVIMVGDRLDADIAGARAVGIRSVLVNFFGDELAVSRDGPKPDAIVNHPQELVTLVLAGTSTNA